MNLHELIDWLHERCISSLSWFVASLITTRIKKRLASNHDKEEKQRSCIRSCIIALDIDFFKSHCSWGCGLWSNKIASKSCNINLKTDGWNRPHRWEIIVIKWLLKYDHKFGVELFMYTAPNYDYKTQIFGWLSIKKYLILRV